MLHRAASLYQAGRSDDLLKLKPYQDAEARVIAHLPGKGRHQVCSALAVETRRGCASAWNGFSTRSGETRLHREAG